MGAGGDMGVGVGELSGGWDYDKEGERMDKQQDGGPAFPHLVYNAHADGSAVADTVRRDVGNLNGGGQ